MENEIWKPISPFDVVTWPESTAFIRLNIQMKPFSVPHLCAGWCDPMMWATLGVTWPPSAPLLFLQQPQRKEWGWLVYFRRKQAPINSFTEFWTKFQRKKELGVEIEDKQHQAPPRTDLVLGFISTVVCSVAKPPSGQAQSDRELCNHRDFLVANYTLQEGGHHQLNTLSWTHPEPLHGVGP